MTKRTIHFHIMNNETVEVVHRGSTDDNLANFILDLLSMVNLFDITKHTISFTIKEEE